MTKKSAGIGIISFAHGHVNAYAEQIRGFEDAHLVACWDADRERGTRQAAHFGIPYDLHLKDLLARKEIECVIVASETYRHASHVILALDAGKDVLLQKPMATTLEDCDRILEAVKRTGQWFSMAFQMRADPQNILMKQLMHQGAIGKISSIRRRHCIPVLLDDNFVNGPSKWHISREANRGMFFDDAIHAIDWLYWMTGEKPVSVTAEIGNTITDVAPDDTGVAIFRYGSGMMAEIFNSSVVLAAENTTEIYGDKGVIIQNHGDSPSCSLKPPHPIGIKMYQREKADLGWQNLQMPIPNGHYERITGLTRPLLDAYREGKALCTAEEGRVSVEMCLAAYRSSETGRRVSFPFEE